MKNKDFWQKLESMYMRGPAPEAKAEYYSRLNRWNLRSKQLEELFGYLTEKCTYYPSLAEICTAAREIGVLDSRPEPKPAHWVAFDMAGRRWYQKCHDPNNPPVPPEEANHIDLWVDDPYRDYRPATKKEAWQ